MSDPIKPRVYEKTAPSDTAAEKAWYKIMELAQSHTLIVQAYGGAATLALPTEQRRTGIRQRILDTHCMNETQEKNP